MIKKILYGALTAIFVVTVVSVSASLALEYVKGTPQEVSDFLSLQNNQPPVKEAVEVVDIVDLNDILGTKLVRNIITHGQLQAQGNASTTFANALIPTSNNVYDLGHWWANPMTTGTATTTGGGAWRDIYASGTVRAGSFIGDGSGITGITGFATPQLDNLSSVAINTSLVSDTNNTDDLGSNAIAWKDAFVTGTVYSGSLQADNLTTFPDLTGFTYVTTTAWTGTSTFPMPPAFGAETFRNTQCFTDAGTLFVTYGDYSASTTPLSASTTVGNVDLTDGNNTFTAGEKRYVEIGTPASSPTEITCNILRNITI